MRDNLFLEDLRIFAVPNTTKQMAECRPIRGSHHLLVTHSRSDQAKYLELSFCDSKVPLFGVVRDERFFGRNWNLFDDNYLVFLCKLEAQPDAHACKHKPWLGTPRVPEMLPPNTKWLVGLGLGARVTLPVVIKSIRAPARSLPLPPSPFPLPLS